MNASFRQRLRQLGPTGLLALLWTAAPAIAGILLLGYIGVVSDWLHHDLALGLIIYTLVFIVAGGCGFLPTYAQAIVGGWVFGIAAGIPAALLGFTGASLLGYGIARTVSRDKVEAMINENRKARVVRDALVGCGRWRTFIVVALLRFPPNSPFALTNLAMASTGVAILPYIFGTMIGMMPRTTVAVVFAATASREARDIQEFVREGPGPYVLIGGIVVMLVVLAILSAIANRALERLNHGGEPVPGTTARSEP